MARREQPKPEIDPALAMAVLGIQPPILAPGQWETVGVPPDLMGQIPPYPELPALEQPQLRVSRHPGWEAFLAGLGSTPPVYGRQQGGPAFVSGLFRGLGGAAAGAAQGRAAMNEAAIKAAAERNRANLEATYKQREQRTEVIKGLKGEGLTRAKEQRAATVKQQEADLVTPTMAAQYSWPASTVGKHVKDLTPEQQAALPKASEPLVLVMGPEGPVYVRKSDALGKQPGKTRAITGVERQALAFYNRAKDAAATADALEQKVTGAGLAGQAQLQYAPNVFKTPEQRQYRQAQRAFTEARLRKESGAAIPLQEFENDARIYFAQPGDDPATIEQKRAKRQTVLDGLAYSSGGAYEEYYGEPMTKRGVAPGKIRMTSPSGKVYEFDAAHADSARAHGWR